MRFQLPQPLHGWRAFVGEVGIIVLGVLIALAANEFVDDLQWKAKVNRAEAAMRLELSRDDATQAYGRMLIGPCLDARIARIHDGAGQVPGDDLRQWVAAYAPPIRGWDSEAWKAVLGSDVGSHMGAERLVQWSSPYRLMSSLTDDNARERDLAIELQQALPPKGEPSPADLQLLRRDAAQLRALNGVFYRLSQLVLARSQAVGAPPPESAKRELLSRAREMYGRCVREPDLNARPLAQGLTADLKAIPVDFGKSAGK
jgi:hypothetical protein